MKQAISKATSLDEIERLQEALKSDMIYISYEVNFKKLN